jgi:hypothetical protein
MLVWTTVGFGFVAILFSLFFGWKACEIFSVPEPKKTSQRVYLFWFNFFGSLVGWLALWVIVFKILRCASGSCQAGVELGDLVVAFVAFAGITGHLPMATMGVFSSLGDIAKVLYKKWLS